MAWVALRGQAAGGLAPPAPDFMYSVCPGPGLFPPWTSLSIWFIQDKNLKLDFLNALTTLTHPLSSQNVNFRLQFPHKPEIVTLMRVSTSQEHRGGNAERREVGSSWKPLVAPLGSAWWIDVQTFQCPFPALVFPFLSSR